MKKACYKHATQWGRISLIEHESFTGVWIFRTVFGNEKEISLIVQYFRTRYFGRIYIQDYIPNSGK